MSMDHPRIRGEHSTRWSPPSWNPGSSPHTRGAHFEVVVDPIQLGIIPAYVGSTPATRPAPRRCEDHPRIRGEHGKASFYDGLPSGSSPHTRGAQSRIETRSEYSRIIPAYAGSTSATSSSTPRKPDHPRIRGEHLSRGCLRVLLGGIIPAYAGSTDGLPIAEWRRADHPRIRGEHVRGPSRQDRESGSSPHTRGARHHARLPTRLPGIIPAYAGSTHTPRTRPKPLADHPRIRGEHFNSILPALPKAGSSPHTRGAPACEAPPPEPRPDHPRIRGEHVGHLTVTVTAGGSSPHTRGAPCRRR